MYLKNLPMTEKEAQEMIKGMNEMKDRLVKSKEACWQFLISAGIETEESRRKFEEKMEKRRKKK
jgi:hypothetical protein